MRTVTMYRVTTTWPHRALPARVQHCGTADDAQQAADFWPNSTATVEQVAVGVFEPGDTINVELHRGGRENDGITTGGAWVSARGVVRSVHGAGGYLSASVWTEDGEHLQEMSAIAGVSGYPYRAAALAA